MTDLGADRIRELLDAVLDDDNTDLDGMATDAHSSAFHFSRQVSRHAGEPPVALRRRVLLERAAWYLQRGATVTDTAFDAGYDSVEGFARAFSRAFGRPPSQMIAAADRGHWLPAPNGVHFHSPTVLYVDSAGVVAEASAGDVLALMVRHDLDDIAQLLAAATSLSAAEFARHRLRDNHILRWQTPDESLAQVLGHLVLDKEPWLATITGAAQPIHATDQPHDAIALNALHGDIAPRWLALTRDIDRRGGWSDRIIDALCDPPESFLLSQILAHVLTFSTHRRQLARWMLREAGVDVSVDNLDPDPIMWHRNRSGGHS